MNKTLSEISRIKGCTRQAVNDFLKKNKIQPSGKKGKLPLYDCSQEPLATYLSVKPMTANQKMPPLLQPDQPDSDSSNPPKAEAAATQIYKPLNALLAGKILPGQKPSSVFYAEAVSLAKKNQDAALLFKLGQIADKEDRDELYQLQMLKTEQAKENIAIERAERMKIENDIKKGMYLELEKVKIFFGRICAVHTSILQPLSLKLSSMLAAMPEGSQKELTIKKIIDGEIDSTLGSIKNLLIDFIKE
jgi:hypothetical protein